MQWWGQTRIVRQSAVLVGAPGPTARRMAESGGCADMRPETHHLPAFPITIGDSQRNRS